MSALPFVFLTNELHVLPSATLQLGQPPPSISIAKTFFQPQIDDIQREFSEVKTMGLGTAEEWFKGLDDRGKERRNDAARWEKWEATGGVARMRTSEIHEAAGVTAGHDGHNSSSTTTNNRQTAATSSGHFQSLYVQDLPHFTSEPSQQVSVLPQPVHTSFRMWTQHQNSQDY